MKLIASCISADDAIEPLRCEIKSYEDLIDLISDYDEIAIDIELTSNNVAKNVALIRKLKRLRPQKRWDETYSYFYYTVEFSFVKSPMIYYDYKHVAHDVYNALQNDILVTSEL